MAPRLAADRSTTVQAVGLHACPPEALSALGPVLCFHAATDGHPLSGWTRARRLLARIRLDSDGPCESLCFFDADGACCWRLHLLPDSDFLAWENLLARLPVEAEADTLLPRLAGAWKRKVMPRWRACSLRLHAVTSSCGNKGLAAADAELSGLGQRCVQRFTGVPHGTTSATLDLMERAWRFDVG